MPAKSRQVAGMARSYKKSTSHRKAGRRGGFSGGELRCKSVPKR